MHGLQAVAGAEFVENTAHVRLDGLRRDDELLGDRPVGFTLGDQPQDLGLTRRQRRGTRVRLARTGGSAPPRVTQLAACG